MNEQDLNLLRQADPADGPTDLEVKRLRRRVMRRTFSSTKFRPLSVAAAVTAFALIGASGIGIGRLTAPDTTALAERTIAISPPAGQSDAMTAKGGAEFGRSDLMYFGSRVILEPTSAISDSSGKARGYAFDASGVDRRALLRALAGVISASGEISNNDGVLMIGSNDGTGANASIYESPNADFYAYNSDRDPWRCENFAPESSVRSDGKGSDSSAPDGCASVTRSAPSTSTAEKEFANVFRALGLDSANVKVASEKQERAVYVTGSLIVEGMNTQQILLAVAVSDQGVFSINGFAAKIKEIDGYEVVGARTAALRSAESRWSGVGPQQIGGEFQYGVPMARSSVEGRPALSLGIDFVKVGSARPGLGLFSSEGGSLILPTWEFTSSDGRTFSMLAVSDKYVQFGK
jgi:hypothetical protein